MHRLALHEPIKRNLKTTKVLKPSTQQSTIAMKAEYELLEIYPQIGHTEYVDSDTRLDRTQITAMILAACTFILIALALKGFTIYASLKPTSALALVVHKFRTATMLVSTLSGVIGGFLIVIIALVSRPRSTTSVILAFLLFVFLVCMPIWTLFSVDILKSHRWSSRCDGFDGAIVLEAMPPNSDRGTTISFPYDLGNTTLTLYQSSQGRYELTGKDGSIIAFYDFRNMTYSSANSSISGPIEEDPIQFPAIGLFSAGEWIERCYGLAATLKDALGNIVVQTGIRLPGNTFKMDVCVRRSVGFDALAIVLGQLSIVLERLGSGCRGFPIPDMKR